MRLVVAVVGKPRDAELKKVISDYETRAAKYWPLEVFEVKEEKGSAGDSSTVTKREGARLMQKLPQRGRTVACHLSGRRKTSEEFAAFLQTSRENARDTAFLIGGAFGLSQDLLDGADMILNLAPWTLPHDLARLVLAEQIYRAGTMVRGEPYHK